jgi:dihydrofolate reductase
LNEGCVDELIITVIPVLIGQGKPLFGQLNKDIELQLVESKNIGSCFVQMHYKVKRHAIG